MQLYLKSDLVVRQFARVRISEGGDTIRTCGPYGVGEDSRDATFVRVRLFFISQQLG